MSEPPSTNQSGDCNWVDDQAWLRFVQWAAATLQLSLEIGADGSGSLSLPEPLRPEFEGRDTVGFTAGDVGSDDGHPRLTADSPLFDWLLRQLRARGEVLHATPASPPVSVQQLAPRLFQPYTVEGGSVHLGGCVFEERPLVRYTYRVGPSASSSSPPGGARMCHVFRDADGQPVDESLRAALRVDELSPRPGPLPRRVREQTRQWHAQAGRCAPAVASGEQTELLLVTAIWCRQVQAKLLFEIGQQRAESRCAGWADLLADGRAVPPPYICPESGLASYHLVATDDGRITVPAAVGVCEESGRRVLRSELGTCALTGRRLLAAFLATCPVTGRRIHRDALMPCGLCRQLVSPTALAAGRCQACRGLTSVRADEPRLARLLGEYPRLSRWSHWRLAETAAAYILTSAYFLYRLLLVVDKESLAVLRLAEGPRLTRRWTDVPEDQWPEYLG